MAINRRSNRRKTRPLLGFEALQSREMMAADILLSGGVLEVTGTDGDNVIEIEKFLTRGGTRIKASVETTSGDVLAVRSYWASSVKRVWADGLAGDDTIRNRSSLPSELFGGPGTDRLHGGNDRDALFGGEGRDYLYAYDGDDYLDGGPGDDYLYGHGGNDAMFGDEGNDRLYGSTGDDRMLGGDGTDRLYGGDGYDIMDGGADYDLLYGQGDGALILDDHAYSSSGSRGYGHLMQNWFDDTLNDHAIRSNARYAYIVDEVIGRQDMINILATAGEGGVTATELADLRAIENPGWFDTGMPEHVEVLAHKVLHANKSNALFQGQTMGNLEAGSSQAHLSQLISKWFLGADRPAIGSDQTEDGATYQYAAGALFLNGVSRDDVDQGSNSHTCYLLAPLAAIASTSPSQIEDMFIDNNDGTFTVRFFVNGKADYVTVDRYLPGNADGEFVYANDGIDRGENERDAYLLADANTEIWVALVEKAYAQLNESQAIGQDGTNSYEGIAYGNPGSAMKHLTNNRGTFTRMSKINNVANKILEGMEEGIVILHSPNDPEDHVTSGHVFAVTDYDSMTGIFTVYDPYGFEEDNGNGRMGMTASEISETFTGMTIGKI